MKTNSKTLKNCRARQSNITNLLQQSLISIYLHVKSYWEMLSSHIRDFLEDCVKTYYDNQLSWKLVQQKNSARPQQDVNQMLSRSKKDVSTIFIRV